MSHQFLFIGRNVNVSWEVIFCWYYMVELFILYFNIKFI